MYRRACVDIEGFGEESLAKYEVSEGDHVWFVIDTDEWDSHISHLRQNCAGRPNWHVAQSNPCFEVWLYYHLFSENAASVSLSDCTAWKNHVNAQVPGGFNSRKHPIYIADAIKNAERCFAADGEEVLYGSTEMFQLGKVLCPMVAPAIEKARRMNGL